MFYDFLMKLLYASPLKAGSADDTIVAVILPLCL
jgi:hypothetical protein